MQLRTTLTLTILAFFLLSCERRNDARSRESGAPPTKSAPRTSTAPPNVPDPVASNPSPLAILRDLAQLPPAAQGPTLTEHLYSVPDEKLDLVLDAVRAHPDPGQKRALLSILYEETTIRPPLARLPLLPELARQPEIDPSLRVSILAELGGTLTAEHGSSWTDWVLAIEEHLAESEGLLRVE
jgi:hypothetical protein